MGKQEVPKPLLIVLVVVVVGAGAYFLLGNSAEETPPPPTTPPTSATGGTGPTGGGPTDATPKKSKRELAKERRQKLIDAANEAGMPLDVYLAKKRGKKVLIFFWEPKGKVDQRVKDSVDTVAADDDKVVVFEAAKVTGTPAIVIIYRDKAGLVVGFVESGALAERIAQVVRS
jgi:hypothetical protein